MTYIKHALVTYLLKQTHVYYKGQELHLSPRAKEQILTSIWQAVQSELHQEFQNTK